MEIAPRQVILIEEVHHDVHHTLDVIPPGLVITATRV
jgi:hypothetical protein